MPLRALFLVLMLSLSSADFFIKKFFQHYQCQTVWIKDQDRQNVGSDSDGPDLGPNCLQMFSEAPEQGKRVWMGGGGLVFTIH